MTYELTDEERTALESLIATHREAEAALIERIEAIKETWQAQWDAQPPEGPYSGTAQARIDTLGRWITRLEEVPTIRLDDLDDDD